MLVSWKEFGKKFVFVFVRAWKCHCCKDHVSWSRSSSLILKKNLSVFSLSVLFLEYYFCFNLNSSTSSHSSLLKKYFSPFIACHFFYFLFHFIHLSCPLITIFLVRKHFSAQTNFSNKIPPLSIIIEGKINFLLCIYQLCRSGLDWSWIIVCDR